MTSRPTFPTQIPAALFEVRLNPLLPESRLAPWPYTLLPNRYGLRTTVKDSVFEVPLPARGTPYRSLDLRTQKATATRAKQTAIRPAIRTEPPKPDRAQL